MTCTACVVISFNVLRDDYESCSGVLAHLWLAIFSFRFSYSRHPDISSFPASITASCENDFLHTQVIHGHGLARVGVERRRRHSQQFLDFKGGLACVRVS